VLLVVFTAVTLSAGPPAAAVVAQEANRDFLTNGMSASSVGVSCKQRAAAATAAGTTQSFNT
jgi:hypothetical protein